MPIFRHWQCSHPTTQRPTTATNHIQQNQCSTPYAVTHGLCSPEDGHNDTWNMLRQKLIINIWLLYLVGYLSLHNLVTMHGHRNLKLECVFTKWVIPSDIVLTSYKTAPHNRYQSHPTKPEQYTKCSNRAFVLLKMGIMIPETCWDRSW